MVQETFREWKAVFNAEKKEKYGKADEHFKIVAFIKYFAQIDKHRYISLVEKALNYKAYTHITKKLYKKYFFTLKYLALSRGRRKIVIDPNQDEV
mmetsp:Transcript_1966/g.1831  ORF Transcript_1966/g.1831 Transcript_1966/m.1831 type:complete len:95 (-) Transcript_1966:154-438(-)